MILWTMAINRSNHLLHGYGVKIPIFFRTKSDARWYLGHRRRQDRYVRVRVSLRPISNRFVWGLTVSGRIEKDFCDIPFTYRTKREAKTLGIFTGNEKPVKLYLKVM